ncbi:MAG: TerB family tellurite resistance protein [Bacteroidota bacterium]|nr:TerB family tellurite resistance protein [Bacteroidota bacterium]
MGQKEKLYDAFGELVYALALSDGEIQSVEIEVLENILKTHHWAKEIKWSFDYESLKKRTVEDAYKKAMFIFKDHGPDPEYKFMLDVLTKVAEAFEGIVPAEKEIIDKFQKELKEKFLNDIEKMN